MTLLTRYQSLQQHHRYTLAQTFTDSHGQQLLKGTTVCFKGAAYNADRSALVLHFTEGDTPLKLQLSTVNKTMALYLHRYFIAAD